MRNKNKRNNPSLFFLPVVVVPFVIPITCPRSTQVRSHHKENDPTSLLYCPLPLQPISVYLFFSRVTHRYWLREVLVDCGNSIQSVGRKDTESEPRRRPMHQRKKEEKKFGCGLHVIHSEFPTDALVVSHDLLIPRVDYALSLGCCRRLPLFLSLFFLTLSHGGVSLGRAHIQLSTWPSFASRTSLRVQSRLCLFDWSQPKKELLPLLDKIFVSSAAIFFILFFAFSTSRRRFLFRQRGQMGRKR